MELMERISCHYQAAGINENMAEVCIVHMYFTAVPKIGDSTDSLSFFFSFFFVKGDTAFRTRLVVVFFLFFNINNLIFKIYSLD